VSGAANGALKSTIAVGTTILNDKLDIFLTRKFENANEEKVKD
jgi:hypothetical protein